MSDEIEADERYQGEWTFFAPGMSIHATRHSAIGAAAIYGRDAPSGFDVDAKSAIRKVSPYYPYLCELCNQRYETENDYRDHLEWHTDYAKNHPEYDNAHPTPEEALA